MKWSDAEVHPAAGSQTEQSPSDTEHDMCDSARGSDAMSDDSSDDSSANPDDILQVFEPAFFIALTLLQFFCHCQGTKTVSLCECDSMFMVGD